jgi:hypothetical protein
MKTGNFIVCAMSLVVLAFATGAGAAQARWEDIVRAAE